MARLFDQFLVIYNNENLPNNIHNLVSRFKFYQKLRKSEINNPNVVKIALAQNGLALYFSRSPIPFSKNINDDYFHHIGIYAYKKNALEKFINLI